MSRKSAGATIGLIAGAAVLTVVVLVRRSPPPASAPPPPGPEIPAAAPMSGSTPLPATPQPVVENPAPLPGERKTGASIRLRRPDGTWEVVEETAELMSRLTTGAMMKTVAQFEAVQKEFRANFHRTLKEQGAVQAWGLLAPYLLKAASTNEDRAQVYESVRLAVEIERLLGQPAAGGSPYEPVRRLVGDALAGFLSSPEVHSRTKSIFLIYLAGGSFSAAAGSPSLQEIDGLRAYDPGAPWQAFLMEDKAGPAHPVSMPDNPALREPAVVDACARLLLDPAAPGDVRAAALRALSTRKEALDRVDLAAVARSADENLGKAAVDLLGRTPNALPATAFFPLLDLHDDPDWKAAVFRRLSGPAFESPDMTAVLVRHLPSQPLDLPKASEASFRSQVLETTLDRYASFKSRPLFDLIVRSVPDWARYEWPLEGSPLLVVAEAAVAHGLKEFAAPLRASIDSVASTGDRERLRTAVTALER